MALVREEGWRGVRGRDGGREGGEGGEAGGGGEGRGGKVPRCQELGCPPLDTERDRATQV